MKITFYTLFIILALFLLTNARHYIDRRRWTIYIPEHGYFVRAMDSFYTVEWTQDMAKGKQFIDPSYTAHLLWLSGYGDYRLTEVHEKD